MARNAVPRRGPDARGRGLQRGGRDALDAHDGRLDRPARPPRAAARAARADRAAAVPLRDRDRPLRPGRGLRADVARTARCVLVEEAIEPAQLDAASCSERATARSPRRARRATAGSEEAARARARPAPRRGVPAIAAGPRGRPRLQSDPAGRWDRLRPGQLLLSATPAMKRTPHLRRTLALAVARSPSLWPARDVALASTIPSQSSPNWAGWVATAVPRSNAIAKHFTNVSGTWVQPAATCTPHTTHLRRVLGRPRRLLAALQGARADRLRGRLQLEAAGSSTTPGMSSCRVRRSRSGAFASPRGTRSARRVHVSSDHVTVSLTDLTTGAPTFTHTTVMRRPPPDTSAAEWIAEAPSNCNSHNHCKPLRLTDFGQRRLHRGLRHSIGSAGRHTRPDRRSRLGLRRRSC